MTYYDLVFNAGAEIGQGLIVFLLIALIFDYLYKMLFRDR